jgi:hypothetical protein
LRRFAEDGIVLGSCSFRWRREIVDRPVNQVVIGD